MSSKISDYKGNAVIELRNTDDDKYPFSFGLGKAKLILAHVEDISKFVADNEKVKQ